MARPLSLMLSTIFTFAVAVSSPATSYYVTQSGAGAQNGTSLGNAWSLAEFNTTTMPTGGDIVYFSGTITSTVSPKANGTGNSSGRLTLDFSAATLTSPAITLSGNTYLTLNGGTIVDGTDGSTLITCAYVNPGVGHDITIQNFKTSPSGLPGGNDTFFSVGSCNSVLIQNNHIDNVVGFLSAYQGKTQNITILNNWARTSQNITQQTDLISLPDSVNIVIQGNELINQAPGSQSNSRHNDVIQTFQSGASLNQTPAGWTIAYNWIEEDVTECADTDGSNSWTMIEQTGGTNYIYGNVFDAPGPCYFGNGETLDGSGSVWYVYNNTYASPNGYPGIWFQSPSGTAYFRNNAFEMVNGNGTFLEDTWATGAPFDYNYLLGVPGCGSSWDGSHGSCSVNPLFTNFSGGVFSLQPSSPLVNAGDSTIGSKYNQGIAPGATWPNPTLVARTTGAWDVGAYQSTTSAVNPPTNLTATAH